ncbi:hypothetical protein L4D12_02305 [Photobacterium nomapromontoriensis]
MSSLYSKPEPELGKDIATLSEEYVKATRGGVLDLTSMIPGKVYHPRDGYIAYERLWCLDEKMGSLAEYRQLIARVCRLKSGKMRDDWCVSDRNGLPLFSATIAPTGTTCTGGDITTIIHTIEPLSSPTASEWILSAEVLGFKKN